MRTLYKTLAEVKVLHEYYLTEADGKTIFDFSTTGEKLLFLEKFFSANRPTIGGDIAFEVPSSFSDTFRRNRLHLIPSYSGFRIMVEVEEVRASDNSINYRPLNPMMPDEMLLIGLRRKNGTLGAFTNERVNNPFPSIYLFSNTNTEDSTSFPSLSAPLPDYAALNTYEQGELTSDGSGNAQSFYMDENGNAQWLPIGGNGFVNERDRMLLPRRFTYSFPYDAAGTDATFGLSEIDGNEIQTIESQVPASTKVTLNFDDKKTTQLKRYRLQVESPALNRTHEIAFFDEKQDTRNYWAVVSLVPRVAVAEFNLIDDDGFIRLKKNPDGTEIQPDFYEIRIKSRPTFWRYANEQGKKLKLNASLNDYLTHDVQQGIMTSRMMRSASATPTMFSGNGNTRFLPHPVSFADLQLENGRIITEIRVPRSDLFDV